MYVCVCNAVTDSHIKVAVAEGASTMRDLRNQLDVATCCGKCGTCAKKVLNEALDEKWEKIDVAAIA
ncbi:MAG: bacterioferritin-associated ferredoxin [Cellvibrionaceae bacterium]